MVPLLINQGDARLKKCAIRQKNQRSKSIAAKRLLTMAADPLLRSVASTSAHSQHFLLATPRRTAK